MRRSESKQGLDPITVSVIRARLEACTDEMDVRMFNAALSPTIADSHDACHGVYRPTDGLAIAQGSHGHPIFIGVMGHAVRAVLERFGAEGIGPGDVFALNDPYLSGTHVQDMKVITPVFVDDRLLCFLAAAGHWTDMGGPAPGGWNPAAQELFHEGLRVPPVRLVREGAMNADALAVILANVRLASSAESDLHSELEILRIGAGRIAALCAQFGRPVVEEAMDQILGRTEEMMRQTIGALPDGRYEQTEWLDNDGITADPIPVRVTAEIAGEHLTLDFSASDTVVAGPFQTSAPTFEAACFVALKHLFPAGPANGAVMQPVTVVAPPERSFLNAMPVQPVGAYTETALRVVDAVMGALAPAAPASAVASAFNTVCSLVISGEAGAGRYVCFLYFGGGLGATEGQDGLNHGPSALSNATMASVELVEERYPLCFRRFELRADSGGTGRRRGGLGAAYEIELRGEEARSFFVGDRGSHGPEGLHGGLAGAPTVVRYGLADGDLIPPLLTKASDVRMRRGDRVVIETPGGGGYGEPREREPERLEADRRLGFVTDADASRAVGVGADAG